MGCDYKKYKPTKTSRGAKILVVPPSQKVFNHFGADAKQYTDNLVENLKTY